MNDPASSRQIISFKSNCVALVDYLKELQQPGNPHTGSHESCFGMFF